MVDMRAKMKVSNVEHNDYCQILNFVAVSKSEGYPEDGTDENNSYSLWTPQAEFSMTITNPNLFGAFENDDEFYVDFTKV